MSDRRHSRRSRAATGADALVGAAKVAAAMVASPLTRRRFNRHGATDEEVLGAMPGDDLVRRPKLGYTRAITIDSPRSEVWRWLAQIGQGRGGLYSYDALENLVGCRIHSADEILDEHQELAAGDIIRSGPDKFPCWMVMAAEPPDHLVLLGAGTPSAVAVPETVDQPPPKNYAAATWQWQLRPRLDGAQTRLVVRQRLTYSPNQALIWRVVEPINFAMERKMLNGLKARSELGRST
jgi:hypothetical protein